MLADQAPGQQPYASFAAEWEHRILTQFNFKATAICLKTRPSSAARRVAGYRQQFECHSQCI